MAKAEEKPNKFQSYDARQKARGFHKVTVWVPEPEKLKAYAGRQRKAHLSKSEFQQ